MDFLKHADERYPVRQFTGYSAPDTVSNERHTVYRSAEKTVFYNEF